MVVYFEEYFDFAGLLIVDFSVVDCHINTLQEVIADWEVDLLSSCITHFECKVIFLQEGDALLGRLVGSMFDYVEHLLWCLHIEQFNVLGEAVFEFGGLHMVEWRDHSCHY